MIIGIIRASSAVLLISEIIIDHGGSTQSSSNSPIDQ
jgi:hypothetical protein